MDVPTPLVYTRVNDAVICPCRNSGDNVGGANNDVGGGESSGAAADPSVPSDGAAAATGGGGVVDNSSPVVEDGDGLTATTQPVHSEKGTPVTVKIVKTAAGNSSKRS